MKMRVVYLTFLLVLLLNIEQISNKNTRSITEGAKADKVNTNANSLGHKVRKNSVLSTFPMIVKSCDQIAIFKAQYITDMNDYKLRADGWYSVSAYTVNLYKDKDANQLIHSVDIGNLKNHPSHLQGGRGCVKVDGGAVNADITVCFPDKATADNLLNVIKTFYNCRRGDNLQPIPKSLLRQLFQMCAKGAGDIKWGNGAKKSSMSLAARAGNKWDADRMRYYHPAGISVPGTR